MGKYIERINLQYSMQTELISYVSMIFSLNPIEYFQSKEILIDVNIEE